MPASSIATLSRRRLTDRLPGEGEIVDANGAVVGHHAGIHRYTIGQRRGIGIAGAQPLYVINIDAPKNQVVVGRQDDLLGREFTAAGVNWVAFDKPADPVRAEVRVRYRHTPAAATITPAITTAGFVSISTKPQRAITPGQATVFYRGDEVVGGGWIVKRQGSGQGARGRKNAFGKLGFFLSLSSCSPSAHCPCLS